MERIRSIHDAEQVLLAKIRHCLSAVRGLLPEEVDGIGRGIGVLSALRTEVYEDINQIQHAALILAAARWLEKNVLDGAPAEWYWNPYQTDGSDEPDLECRSGARVIVAEATASAEPKGLIDRRMAATLAKLSRMAGSRYYLVRTEAMGRRAETKIRKAQWDVQVVVLP